MASGKSKIALLAFGLIGAFVVYKLASLQVFEYQHYRAMVHGQKGSFQLALGERGDVFFKGGEILAGNSYHRSLVIVPEEIKDKERVLNFLSDILEIEKEVIEENYLSLTPLKENLSIEESQRIKMASMPGVYVREERKRMYPQENIASHVIGFLGGENIGQYGIEGYHEGFLRGAEAIKESGFFDSSSLKRGGNIVLTLDYNIQFMAERLLEEAKEKYKIEGGSIIVVNPKNGEIMAMANYPGFNPNSYSKVEDFSIFKNPSIQKVFEPGSIFKAITIAGAIDKGKITPDTEYLDTGEIRIVNRILRNYNRRVFGRVTMREVLEKSINTGAVFAGQALGKEDFLYYMEAFGFSDAVGIELQGEIFSENREFRRGYEVNYATASYGHGINTTPIQIVRAFSVFANGGRMINPYIVKETIKDGRIFRESGKISENQVINEDTALKVTSMLVSVTEDGFGRSARIPGYYIAGKTGTSQIPFSVLGINRAGYSEYTWQSFVGFAPAFDPQFLILVKLDKPQTRTAEYSAMPVFRELSRYLIGYLQIPPDYET